MRNPVPIPEDGKLRSFSIITLILAFILFMVCSTFLGRGILWWTGLELAFWGLFGAIYPFVIIPLYWIVAVVGQILRFVFVRLATALYFYLFVTPLALVARPAQPDPKAASLWSPVKARGIKHLEQG